MVVKALCRDQPYLSRSSKCMDVVISIEDLLSACEEQSTVLATAWIVWGISLGPLSQNTIGFYPILVLKASFGDKRWLVKSLSFSILGDIMRNAYAYFRKFPLPRVSILPSKCSSVLAISSHIPYSETIPFPLPIWFSSSYYTCPQ